MKEKLLIVILCAVACFIIVLSVKGSSLTSGSYDEVVEITVTKYVNSNEEVASISLSRGEDADHIFDSLNSSRGARKRLGHEGQAWDSTYRIEILYENNQCDSINSIGNQDIYVRVLAEGDNGRCIQGTVEGLNAYLNRVLWQN